MLLDIPENQLDSFYIPWLPIIFCVQLLTFVKRAIIIIDAARSESRYVAQALASVKMMDHVIDASRRGRNCQNFVADPDDYVSVKPITVAKMLAVSDKFVSEKLA